MTENDTALKEEYDPVSPPHYKKGKFKVWDVILDWGLDYFLGNAVKYIARCEHKGRKIEDLRKAIAYLEKKIRNIKEENGKK